MQTLDKLDRHILRSLQANGRVTYDHIADEVGLSPSAVLRRVRRLEEAGVIDRYVALVKPAAVGLIVAAALTIAVGVIAPGASAQSILLNPLASVSLGGLIMGLGGLLHLYVKAGSAGSNPRSMARFLPLLLLITTAAFVLGFSSL